MGFESMYPRSPSRSRELTARHGETAAFPGIRTEPRFGWTLAPLQHRLRQRRSAASHMTDDAAAATPNNGYPRHGSASPYRLDGYGTGRDMQTETWMTRSRVATQCTWDSIADDTIATPPPRSERSGNCLRPSGHAPLMGSPDGEYRAAASRHRRDAEITANSLYFSAIRIGNSGRSPRVTPAGQEYTDRRRCETRISTSDGAPSGSATLG